MNIPANIQLYCYFFIFLYAFLTFLQISLPNIIDGVRFKVLKTIKTLIFVSHQWQEIQQDQPGVYSCDDEVLKQIREFVITTMMPDEDIVLNHCIVTVVDRSNRFLNRPKETRYFDVAFHVMYNQIGNTFVGEPVLEITYDAAEELTKDEYKRRKEALPAEEVLREAKRIINPYSIQ